MHGTSAADRQVEGSGDQVAPHVGLALMAAFADRIGLGDSVSAAVPWRGEGRSRTTAGRCWCTPD